MIPCKFYCCFGRNIFATFHAVVLRLKTTEKVQLLCLVTTVMRARSIGHLRGRSPSHAKESLNETEATLFSIFGLRDGRLFKSTVV